MKLSKLRNRRGASTVEFAMTLPVLLLLMFGGYELSRANMIMHTCEAAAYEGARVGIVPGVSSTEVQDVTNAVLSTVGVKNAGVSVQPSDLSVPTDTVAVTVQVSFAENSLLAPLFMGTSTFNRTCTLTREAQ